MAEQKKSETAVDPDTASMDEIEAVNYQTLRDKGFGTDESRFHATNPAGRLHPEGTPDPWEKVLKEVEEREKDKSKDKKKTPLYDHPRSKKKD